MNLTPVMHYLRDVVVTELDRTLAELRSEGGAREQIDAGERHRSNVVDMLEMHHGPDTMADYLAWRAERLEAFPARTAEERAFVETHAPWCRRAAQALSRATIFTLDDELMAA